VLGYTIAAEIGSIERFASPKKLCGYTGLCPRVYQSGQLDRRGSLAKNGPKFLRWALIEAATHAARHPRLPRQEDRAGRNRAPARRSDLAHAHPQTNPSPRRSPRVSGRLTALLANWTARASLPPT
jgi:transposase